MKMTLLTISVLFFMLFNGSIYSLTNFGYRGVAFDAHGEIMASQTVEVTIEIIKTSGVVYKETHPDITTDQFGAYEVEVGTGTVETGDLANVTATKDMKIKSAVSGGGVWVISTILKPITAITDFSNSAANGSNSNLDAITIGNQTWTSKNLDVTTYRNGDPIPQVTDATEWNSLTTGAWCYYNNDASNNATYGKMYNWYAVNDPRGLAPTGWHVPTDAEWKTLEMELGMTQAQADAIGFRGTDEGSQLADNAALWRNGLLETNANFGASGFDGLPGGYRLYNGSFYYRGNTILWWAASEAGPTNAWSRNLHYNNARVYRNSGNKKNGYYVRLVQD
jgi:uncharacterized protein (TIGR02145 family)